MRSYMLARRASPIGMPSAWPRRSCWNSRSHRLGRLGRDDLQAIAERQAGLHAADDDVDGVRKLVEELLAAALAAKRRNQRGRPKPPTTTGRPTAMSRAADSAASRTTAMTAQMPRDEDEEGRACPAQAGLRDPRMIERQLLAAAFCFSRAPSGFAARICAALRRSLAVAPRAARSRGRRSPCWRFSPRALAGQTRIEQRIGDAADASSIAEDDNGRIVQIHRRRAPCRDRHAVRCRRRSAASSAAASRLSSP